MADWSCAGRVVLVGDAAHKFTPSTGAGCNTGIVDVVVLANGLRRAFDAAAAAAAPDAAALAAVFRAYQGARQAAADTGCAIAGRAELTIEGQTITLEPMNSWVVPKGAEHSYRILEEFTAVEATSPPAEVHGRDKG